MVTVLVCNWVVSTVYYWVLLPVIIDYPFITLSVTYTCMYIISIIPKTVFSIVYLLPTYAHFCLSISFFFLLFISWYVPLSLIYSQHDILRDMWPEGAQAVTEVTKRPKSTGTIFKESMIALVANLKTKVSYLLNQSVTTQHVHVWDSLLITSEQIIV